MYPFAQSTFCTISAPRGAQCRLPDAVASLQHSLWWCHFSAHLIQTNHWQHKRLPSAYILEPETPGFIGHLLVKSACRAANYSVPRTPYSRRWSSYFVWSLTKNS